MPPKGAKVLVDNCVPFTLVVELRKITTFDYIDAFSEGVHDIDDAPLLDYAEQLGCSVLLTCDQAIEHQQAYRPDRPVGLVVVETNDGDAAIAHIQDIRRAIQSITAPGKIVRVPVATSRKTTRNVRRH